MNKKKNGYIKMINGPVIKAKGTIGFMMHEVVRVGDKKLVGEVIALEGDESTIQVYEETTGLKPGEEVIGTDSLLSVTLGPGIISKVFDGIQRPLEFLKQKSGNFLERGVEVPSIDMEKEWDLEMLIHKNEEVVPGQIFAKVQETKSIEHRIMIPNSISGTVEEVVRSGSYKADEVLLTVNDGENKHRVRMFQRWPVRVPRPYKNRLNQTEPLITGQRVIDTFFPLSKGGTAAIPGGFGTGKTITQHQLAKWADADIIIYIGCGERGNEMTDVLTEFPELKDPRTGRPLMERTVLIANTSNMPVSAREASIYTGITIAEYFRDMGYNVALMADSTSRWAEALREISGRLEEMPAEEGFPPYLASRLAEFYERAGRVEPLGSENSFGSVSVIGSVSPPGGDFSEPVTKHTKRFTRCFWALDKSLANERHYPSVNWLTSYSEYLDDLEEWYKDNLDENFIDLRRKILALLNEDDRLQQIIKLVGEDVLPDDQKLVVRVGRIIKTGYLQQSAFSDNDAFCSLKRQYNMLKTIYLFYQKAKEAIEENIAVSEILDKSLVNKMMRMKENISDDNLEAFDDLENEINEFFNNLHKRYEKE